MKKYIGLARIDSSLASWLYKTLQDVAAQKQGAAELLEELKSLAQGQTATLVVELNGVSVPENAASASIPSADVVQVGSLTIDARTRIVMRNGTKVLLTPKEFDILYFLIKHKGEVCSKEQIYNAVWGGEYLLDSSNIMAFIRKLRKKIEPNPDEPTYILTVWGVGYKFSDMV